MKFPKEHGNVGVRHVDRPDVISKYFKDSNVVDRHNQVRQFKLRIEKGWVTLNPYFRLFTTVLGIHVADCWKLAHYHNLINQKKTAFFVDEDPEDSLPIKKFSGILSQQLLNMADCLKKTLALLVLLFLLQFTHSKWKKTRRPRWNRRQEVVGVFVPV